MKKDDHLPLGTPVIVIATMERVKSQVPVGQHRTKTRKDWRRTEASAKGFIMGLRTLSSGVVDFIGFEDGFEDGLEWQPDIFHRVYVVAVDMYKKPLLVPLDAVTVADTP